MIPGRWRKQALFIGAAVLVVAGFAAAIAYVLPEPLAETVLPTGTVLTVRNVQGIFTDTALSPTRREFTWRDRKAQDDLSSRGVSHRWYGVYGMYDPSASLRGPGWSEVGNFEEAQVHLANRVEALKWLERVRNYGLQYMWTSDGLLVNFIEAPADPAARFPGVLTVDVHQMCVSGKKPHHLPGASDKDIHITTMDGKPAATLACSNPGPVNNDVEIWPPLPFPLPS